MARASHFTLRTKSGITDDRPRRVLIQQVAHDLTSPPSFLPFAKVPLHYYTALQEREQWVWRPTCPEAGAPTHVSAGPRPCRVVARAQPIRPRDDDAPWLQRLHAGAAALAVGGRAGPVPFLPPGAHYSSGRPALSSPFPLAIMP